TSSVAQLRPARSVGTRPTEQSGQLLLDAVDQRNAALVAEARRVVEGDDIGVPFNEMRAEVEPRCVVGAMNDHTALHDLSRMRGGLATHDIRVGEAPGALHELPVADAR